jgi:hypothetical protein
LDNYMTALAAAETPSRASTVQKVVSKGGVEAWLVEDYAIPLIALEFAFKGGATQDPIGRPGAATLLAGLLDEGAGAYDSGGFHRALDEDAIEMSFSADRDILTGRMQSLSRNSARAFALLQLAVTEARLDVVGAVRGMRARWAGRSAWAWPQSFDPRGESRVRHHRGDPSAEGQTPLEHPLDEPSCRDFSEFGPAHLVEERFEATSPEDLQALQRPEVRGEILGCDRALSQSTRASAGAVLRREEPVPGARTHAARVVHTD